MTRIGPPPGDIDRVIEESRHAIPWNGRVDQFDVNAFLGIKSERLGGIEWRIKHRAEVFSESDWHEERPTMRDGRG
jgi:hypothetical protein